MPTPANLAAITSFKQLLPYLEEHLEWPIERYTFEDLTFAFEPEELGLKPEFAAKIKSIHQLRPLRASQPFGIFFVEFEQKKLPLVVLRSILNHLAIKKRASANKTATPAWHAQDILFISAFGEDGTAQREIAFAHFHQTDGDLPTLRVLGWDIDDTPLKLAHVDGELRRCLRWPADESDAAQWRAKWSAAFKHRPGYVIRRAAELAQTLALFARQIREAAVTKLAAESERGDLRKLYKGFQAALIHDLTEEAFADTYAQTITYGLLTAAISRTDKAGKGGGTALIADNIADMVPVTNPFLKDMLETFLRAGGRKGGINFDVLGIQDVVDLLRDREKTDLAAVLRDFNNKTQGEDPVIHFYEHFLSAYNKRLKIQRGVFYTPQPVVSYIVRSVHELLQTEFGLEDGLASTVTWGEMLKRNPNLKLPDLSDDPVNDPKPLSEAEPFVQILDPATGTATFLVEAIDVIHKHLKAKWDKSGLAAMPTLPLPTDHCLRFTDFWNLYVPKCLLPRLHGYELLMAPYAIAHMKLGLKLHETGYRFATDERARIYLTNALEPKVKQIPHIAIEALAHEAKAVNEIKWYKRFTVVIGNPPYSNFGQQNKIPFILGLLEDYKRGLDEKKINLNDDFIKFIRFSQFLLDSTKYGVLGMITNNVFIDGITHRRMRESIKSSFNDVRILDLHGSTKKLEVSKDRITEENVFDIQQGVGISLYINSSSAEHSGVKHADLWGSRDTKYETLRQTTASKHPWLSLDCAGPHFFFVPKKLAGLDEYTKQPCVAGEVFVERNAGIQTKRDGLVYQFTEEELENTLHDVRNMTPQALVTKYNLPEDGRDWAIQWAQIDVRKGDGKILKVAYHPFDSRLTLFTGRTKGFMAYPRTPLMWSALNSNRLLLTVRNPRRGNVNSFFVADGLVDKDSVSPFDNVTFFPLYVYSDARDSQEMLSLHAERSANFTGGFLKTLSAQLNLAIQGRDEMPTGLTPEDIFHYIYAILYSPTYRTRYAEFLKIDFPRVPLTNSLDLFRALTELGGELVALHLMGSPKLDNHMTKWVADKKQEVEKVTYSDDTVWIDKAKTTGFKGVPEDVWAFHIGGYQVCERWLKDRKGRTLSDEDITHYHKIVVALSETIRLMSDIDAVIAAHGGWPGAFATKEAL